MDKRAKIIFPVLMSGVMAFLVTVLVTALNLGFPTDYLSRWLHAFVIGWPFACIAAFIAIPVAPRATDAFVSKLG